MTTVPLLVYAVNQKNHKKMSAFTQELWRKTATARSPLVSSLRRSEVSAALLLAVVVKLTLPVHHVGRPAVKLHLPLTFCLIYVV